MKKRVLSLFMALALCLTMLPTAVLAEIADNTVQNKQDGTNANDSYIIDKDTEVKDEEKRDAAVEAAQALIDALPEDVTAENAEEIEQRLIALDAALEALTDEQLAQLDMTRYEAICAAMTALAAVQDGEHTDHPICGKADCTETEHELSDSESWVPIGNAEDLKGIAKAGHYYLTKNVTLESSDSTWEPASGVVLCLNGNSITATDNFDVISVANSRTFTLCDCQNTGSITHANGNTGRGVLIDSGTFHMYGGSITGNTANNSEGNSVGGGVSVSYGTFNMYGGSITGNSANNTDDGSGCGGGVYMQGGTFNMTGGSIGGSGETDANTAGSYGGGVYVYYGTFTMSGGSVIGNSATAENGGGVYVDGGTFTMSGDAKITGNTATSFGGGVYVDGTNSNKGTFNMTGGSIGGSGADANTAKDGGGVYVNSNGAFDMSGGSITGNIASRYGGGVFVYGDSNGSGTFTMSETASITGNTASSYGGGVYVDDGAFNMDGGSIANNGSTTAKNGGGVYVNSGTFTMSSGEINGNTATTYGGGVFVYGAFTMSGGSITGNTAALHGGGVYVATNGAFNMSGDAKITSNTASTGNTASSYGGGVYVSSDGTFTMTSGSITGNTATGGNGGGVGMRGGTFTMSGGSITGNTATAGNTATSGDGGGVYVNGTFNISGAPSITGNTGADDAANNLYLDSNSEAITVTGELTGREGSIGVTSGANFVSSAANVAVGDGTHPLTEDDAKRFCADSSIYETVYDESRGAIVIREKPHEHFLCGTTCGHETGHSDMLKWRPLTYNASTGKLYCGDMVVAKGSDNAYDLKEGNYYLIEDITISGTIRAKNDNVNLCLNGHSITVTDSYYAIQVSSGTFTLTDCNGSNGSKTFKKDSTTGQWVLGGSGDVTVTGGIITHASGQNDGAVEVDSGAVFTMYGGTLVGNTGTNGTVYVNGGDFTMLGGAIKGNYFTNGGGVGISSGTFIMSGGSIVGNSAKDNGGGVYVSGGTFTMTDGTIGGSAADDANTAGKGGGVYVASSGTFNMSGGKVTGNSATKDGGGVRLDNGTFNMSGSAVVSRNTAGGSGGGVDVNDGSFTMSDGRITGNNATDGSPDGGSADWNRGGGVSVYDGGSFTMSGGSITGNNAVMGGGVDLLGSGMMTVSGSVQITGNWQSGTLENASGLYVKGDKGKANNLYLFRGRTVTIDTAGLNDDACIGVITYDDPSVKIATNATEELDYYAAIFTPDAEDSDYEITKNTVDNTLYLSVHVHTWAYTANEATHTITAQCSKCNQSGGSVQLKAPDESTLTYNGEDKAATVTASNNWQGPAVSGITIGYTYEVNGYPAALSPGEAPINARTYTASITLGDAKVSVEYTINKAELTITANPATIVYGDTAVSNGVTYEGFVEGENESVLCGSLTYEFNYTPGSDIGYYSIKPQGLTANNYTITFTPGTLTVTEREVTLTWYNYENRTYGDGKTVYATAGNLVNGDEIGVTVTGGAETAVGIKHTAKATALTGAKAGNYKLPAKNAKEYTIDLAKQTLTFKDSSVGLSLTYGDTLDNPAANDREDGGKVTYTSSNTKVATVDENGVVTAKGVGTTTITATAAAVAGKYTEGKAGYTLAVTQRDVTVTVKDASRIYGEANPDFMAELTKGTYAPGDNFQSLKLTLTTEATVKSNVGSYDVTGKANNTNYKVTVLGKEKLTIQPRPITGAVIMLDAESLAYNGLEQTVSITFVTLDGWSDAISYDIVDNSNKATDASDSITLTIEGKGNYTGTATKTWKITKIDPVLANFDVTPDLAAALTYDGDPKTVAVTAKSGIHGMGTVTVKYNGGTEVPTNAGSYTVTIDVADGSNYNAKKIEIGTLTINRATAPTLSDICESYKYTLTGEKTVNVSGLVTGATGYTLGAAIGNAEIISATSVDASGVVKYTLTGTGAADDTVTLPVTIASTNYANAIVNVVITLTAKDDQDALNVTGGTTVVYGQTLQLGASGGSGTGKVTYAVSNGTGEATIDANTGVLMPVKAGTVKVTASKAEDANYNAAKSAEVEITISKATPAGAPKYTAITSGGKTLTDAALTTEGGTFSVSGTVMWVDADGNALAGDTEVKANISYKWRFTPTDIDNYNTLEGSIKLYSVSTGGGGSTVTPPTTTETETTTDPDGTTTKTETKSDGSTVETVTKPDGSTSTTETKTETKPDGTTTTTETKSETKADGSKTETKSETTTAADGSKTETKSESKTEADGTRSETETKTETNPDGSTTTTETKSEAKADGSTTETKSETTAAADGSKTETKSETKSEADGTKSETKMETKTDANGVTSGTETTKTTTPNGSTGTTTTTTENGNSKTEAEAEISEKAVEDAKKSGEAVKVPTEVKAGEDSSSAPTVKVELPKDAGETKIEIPVSDVNSGTVAVIVHEDGTEEIVKSSTTTENGLQLKVDGSATIKVIDNSKTFDDTQKHWSRDEVNFVASRELFNGVGNKLFGVNESMTRGMVNTVLARLAGIDTTPKNGQKWYVVGTEWAKANGITDGSNPEASVTREQLAAMLYRFSGTPEVSGSLLFNDAHEISGYAENALLWAVQNGILNGVGDNRVAPKNNAERAQVAAMMARYLKNVG